MIIHTIHDLSNKYVTDMLQTVMARATDPRFVENYHPKYSNSPANLFYILENGRFKEGHGAYFVAEEDGVFVCSSGWNVYDFEPDTAIISRSYTEHRVKYYLGRYLLPLQLEQTRKFKSLWLTVNLWNDKLRARFAYEPMEDESLVMPDIYRQFSYIGKKIVYNVEQHVFCCSNKT